VSSIARSGWHRVKSSMAGELSARVGHEFDTRFTERLDRLQAGLDAVAGSLAVMRRELSDLADTIAVESEVHAQTTELFGRLLQSSTARIEALEEAITAAPDA